MISKFDLFLLVHDHELIKKLSVCIGMLCPVHFEGRKGLGCCVLNIYVFTARCDLKIKS